MKDFCEVFVWRFGTPYVEFDEIGVVDGRLPGGFSEYGYIIRRVWLFFCHLHVAFEDVIA